MLHRPVSLLARLQQNLPQQCHHRLVSPRLQPKTPSRSMGLSQYRWIPGVESLERYKPGGYHPVSIGDCINGRYTVVDKLGFGGYSTVWLAHETSASRYVALKIATADANTLSLLEVQIIKELSSNDTHRSVGRDSLMTISESFQLEGPNGTHQAFRSS